MRNNSWKPKTNHQLVYGYAAFWSVIIFGIGIGLTWWELPLSFKESDIPQWKFATWVWLNAHGVEIAGSQLSGVGMSFQTVDFINNTPKLHLLRVLPIAFASTVALMVTVSMGGIRDKYILQNCVAGGIGYAVVGLGAIVVSGARPGIGILLGVMGILAASAYIGSLLANALPIPIFAITSIGALVGIGLLTIGGVAVVTGVILPVGKKATVGLVMAGAGMWIANNLG